MKSLQIHTWECQPEHCTHTDTFFSTFLSIGQLGTWDTLPPTSLVSKAEHLGHCDDSSQWLQRAVNSVTWIPSGQLEIENQWNVSEVSRSDLETQAGSRELQTLELWPGKTRARHSSAQAGTSSSFPPAAKFRKQFDCQVQLRKREMCGILLC